MRRTLICWLVALIGVSSIAGCGLFRGTREGCSGGCANGSCSSGSCSSGGCSNGGCSNGGCTSGSSSGRRMVRLDGTGAGSHVVVQEQNRGAPINDETPTPAPTRKAAQPTPTARPAAAQPIKRVDPLVEENAILDREADILRKKGTGKAPNTTEPSLPKVESIRTLPDVPAPMPPGPAKPAIETIPGLPVAPIDMSSDTPSVSVMPVEAPIPAASEPMIQTAQEIVGGKEKTVTLKSVHIHFGQTDNYKSVTGEVQLFRKMVRLRYMAIDQEDTYGGVVVLDGGAELSQLRDGQHVRVSGVLVPPESRTATARYRVQAIEVLD